MAGSINEKTPTPMTGARVLSGFQVILCPVNAFLSGTFPVFKQFPVGECDPSIFPDPTRTWEHPDHGVPVRIVEGQCLGMGLPSFSIMIRDT